MAAWYGQSILRGRVYRAELRHSHHIEEPKYFLVASNNRRNDSLPQVLTVRLTTSPKPPPPDRGAGGYHASLESVPGTRRVVVEAVAERPPVRVEDLITVEGLGNQVASAALGTGGSPPPSSSPNTARSA